MEKRSTRRGAVGPLGVVLALLLALTLAALAVFAVFLWADSQPGPRDLRPGGEAAARTLSLRGEATAVTGEAPLPAQVPELISLEGDDGIVEILGQEEGLLVARLLGKRYRGFVAIVDDPLRLDVGTCPYFGSGLRGQTVQEMADAAGAVLGINGGGFSDDGGMGSGGMPIGNVVSGGEMRWAGGGATVGMDAQGKLHVGEFSGNTCRDMGLVWAVAYGPILIKDGEIRSGLSNDLEEPRTAVGQREDGAVVLVNIQGRQVSGLGVTCRQLARIMEGFGCVNAGNLDGGASSDMYYRGEYLNIANSSGGPRPIPTSVLVFPARAKEG